MPYVNVLFASWQASVFTPYNEIKNLHFLTTFDGMLEAYPVKQSNSSTQFQRRNFGDLVDDHPLADHQLVLILCYTCGVKHVIVRQLEIDVNFSLRS